MPADDYTATTALKRYAPFWASVRETLTLRVAVGLLASLLVTSVTAIVQFSKLRGDVTELKETFRTSKAQGEEIAALRTQVDALNLQVQKLQDRADWQDQVVREPNPKLRRRPQR